MNFSNSIGINFNSTAVGFSAEPQNEKQSWYQMWDISKKEMLATMERNMKDDIEQGGWNPNGEGIKRQEAAIADYYAQYQEELMHFAEMTEHDINKWCYFNLKSRGYID